MVEPTKLIMSNHLLKTAEAVLRANWRDGFTIPCEGLYPFQWNWDSGFIAIGWAHVDMEHAKSEIRSLLSGQWKNGFIPQIVFHNPSDSYYPGPDVHEAYVSPNYPTAKQTSGITQPPVLGFVLEELHAISDEKILDFIAEVYDDVYRYHQYFYTHRDPNKEGLVYICHNWEAGTDNTPVWDEIWEIMDTPDIPTHRKDNTHIDSSNRPSNREYQHYIYLLQLFKEWGYDDRSIAEYSPFLVQDPLFNAMLVRSNESLISLGKLLQKHDHVKQLETWNVLSRDNFHEKLYSEEKKAYVYYDVRNDRKIDHVSSSSFVPMFARIPSSDIASTMIQTYFEKGAFSGKDDELYLCASFDPSHVAFDPKRYWRGPVWVNVNWLIYRGLKRYGINELASKVKQQTLQLVAQNGFYEYFDPRKSVQDALGHGYGGNNFSWSAALTIDLLKEKTN